MTFFVTLMRIQPDAIYSGTNIAKIHDEQCCLSHHVYAHRRTFQTRGKRRSSNS